jgi:hypothetical protein
MLYVKWIHHFQEHFAHELSNYCAVHLELRLAAALFSHRNRFIEFGAKLQHELTDSGCDLFILDHVPPVYAISGFRQLGRSGLTMHGFKNGGKKDGALGTGMGMSGGRLGLGGFTGNRIGGNAGIGLSSGARPSSVMHVFTQFQNGNHQLNGGEPVM